MPDIPPEDWDLQPVVHLLTEEEGGRRTPARSGYRPGLSYAEGWQWSLPIWFPPPGVVAPGASAIALGRLLQPELHVGKLDVGQEVQLCEGRRVVARARIVALGPKLTSASRVETEQGQGQG